VELTRLVLEQIGGAPARIRQRRRLTRETNDGGARTERRSTSEIDEEALAPCRHHTRSRGFEVAAGQSLGWRNRFCGLAQ
jgi:hypothetical protein